MEIINIKLVLKMSPLLYSEMSDCCVLFRVDSNFYLDVKKVNGKVQLSERLKCFLI